MLFLSGMEFVGYFFHWSRDILCCKTLVHDFFPHYFVLGSGSFINFYRSSDTSSQDADKQQFKGAENRIWEF